MHLVIHYDPIVTDDAELNHMRTFVQETIRAIDPELTLHDFRMVRGAQHTNLIFDLVIPYSLVGKQAELKHRIDERVQQEDRKYYTVITFDCRCAGREPVLAWNSGFIKQPAVESVKLAAGMWNFSVSFPAFYFSYVGIVI